MHGKAAGSEQRTILHIDMDAFYASVEQLDHPEYRGKPVIVGGDPKVHLRGVVSTASYEARSFGIRSAMPLREAYRRCPHGIFLPVRMERYREISRELMAIYRRYTPLVEPLALDEVFLDVTHSRALFGEGEQIGKSIQEEIRNKLGLSASVGVAPNKFLAKIASDLQKPGGFVTVKPESVKSFLSPLGIHRLWGVGEKTVVLLHGLGIKTIGDIQRRSEQELIGHLGESAGRHIWELAHGIDPRPVTPVRLAKSIGKECTFHRDETEAERLKAVFWELCENVARRLRRQGLRGRVAQVKIRTPDYTTKTRQCTLKEATDLADTIMSEAWSMFLKEWKEGSPLRLVGISVSGLKADDMRQMELFAEPGENRKEALAKTLDQIVGKYGNHMVKRALVYTLHRKSPLKITPKGEEE